MKSTRDAYAVKWFIDLSAPSQPMLMVAEQALWMFAFYLEGWGKNLVRYI